MVDVLYFLSGTGISSAVFGYIIFQIQRRLKRNDDVRQEKDQVRHTNEILTSKMLMAALTLGEATAEAVQRIPDVHCNGEMSSALEFAHKVKQEYHEFERQQTAKSVI